jgi:hypothetical protein
MLSAQAATGISFIDFPLLDGRRAGSLRFAPDARNECAKSVTRTGFDRSRGQALANFLICG